MTRALARVNGLVMKKSYPSLLFFSISSTYLFLFSQAFFSLPLQTRNHSLEVCKVYVLLSLNSRKKILKDCYVIHALKL